MRDESRSRREARQGVLLGLLAVSCFALTLPATKLAVGGFPPATVALGRVALAGVLALSLLAWAARRGELVRPRGSDLRRLVVCCLSVAVSFPFLIAWALARTSSSHAAVVLALQPLVTAGFAVMRAGERPGPRFWVASGAGALLSGLYFVSRASGPLEPADAALVLALVVACLGYVEAALLARRLGALRVTLWASALPAPVVLPLFLLALASQPLPTDPRAWVGLCWVGLVSQLLAAVPWFRGLALGGAARVGQVQLAQPFLTLGLSAWLLHEPIGLDMSLTAAGVVTCALLAIRARPSAPFAAPPGLAASFPGAAAHAVTSCR